MQALLAVKINLKCNILKRDYPKAAPECCSFPDFCYFFKANPVIQDHQKQCNSNN